MSAKRYTRERPMLDVWRPPGGAGDPVGCLATTYTFDAGFFEEECLARFLEIDSLPDREGLAYLLERENKLGAVYAGVLVDYSQAGVDHSLRWDVLPVRVPGGKQHAKLTLLVWTKRIRIVAASANLTPTGYRRNREVCGTVELRPEECNQELLEQSCGFLGELAALAAGGGEDAARRRAAEFLARVRRQAGGWKDVPRYGWRLRRRLCFTLPGTPGGGARRSSLTEALAECQRAGGAPAEVRVASPFFDPADGRKEDAATAALCSRMARGKKRSLTLCVPAEDSAGETLRLAAPFALWRTAKDRVDRLRVEALPGGPEDGENRPWHAKMLALSNANYSALMIGSSNFTRAGMGAAGGGNAEANLLYIARRQAAPQEARELEALWPPTTPVPDPESAEWEGPRPDLLEEEQAAAPAPPAGFVSAVYRAGDEPALVFRLEPASLPGRWQVLGGPKLDERLLDNEAHAALGRRETVVARWLHPYAPSKLLVVWEDNQAFWPVNVEDPAELPAPRELEGMTAEDLLYLLAASDVSAAFRVLAGSKGTAEPAGAEELDEATPPDLDPLRRYRLEDTFLHRIRQQARLLQGVREGLERPVWSERALEWRLTGMIGIEQLVRRMAGELHEDGNDASETALRLADLFLTLSEVHYREAEGALSKQRFEARYKRFLRSITWEVDREIHSTPGLSAEVRRFWRRVRERVQQ